MSTTVINPEQDVTKVDQMDTTALAKMQGRSGDMALQTGGAAGTMSGEINMGSIITPWLSLVHPTSKIVAQGYNPGDWVLAKEHRLVEKGKPLNVIVVSTVSYWKEYLSQDMFQAGVQPRRFSSEKECLAAGGITQWPPRGSNLPKPNFSEALFCRILIQQPEGVACNFFAIEIDGKKYAPAFYDLDKNAFKNAGKQIVTYSMYQLGGNPMGGLWTLTSTQILKGNPPKPTVIPNAALVRKFTAEELATVKASLNIESAFRRDDGAAAAAEEDAETAPF